MGNKDKGRCGVKIVKDNCQKTCEICIPAPTTSITTCEDIDSISDCEAIKEASLSEDLRVVLKHNMVKQYPLLIFSVNEFEMHGSICNLDCKRIFFSLYAKQMECEKK